MTRTRPLLLLSASDDSANATRGLLLGQWLRAHGAIPLFLMDQRSARDRVFRRIGSVRCVADLNRATSVRVLTALGGIRLARRIKNLRVRWWQRSFGGPVVSVTGSGLTSPDLLALLPPGTPVRTAPPESVIPLAPLSPERQQSERQGLGMPASGPVVGTFGGPRWEDGADMVIRAMHGLATRWPHVHLLWLGCDQDDIAMEPITHDLHRLDLTDKVHFGPSKMVDLQQLLLADVLLLGHRRPPSVLHLTAAAATGLPILRAAGPDPWPAIGLETTTAVAHGDADALAKALADLLGDLPGPSENARTEHGDLAVLRWWREVEQP